MSCPPRDLRKDLLPHKGTKQLQKRGETGCSRVCVCVILYFQPTGTAVYRPAARGFRYSDKHFGPPPHLVVGDDLSRYDGEEGRVLQKLLVFLRLGRLILGSPRVQKSPVEGHHLAGGKESEGEAKKMLLIRCKPWRSLPHVGLDSWHQGRQARCFQRFTPSWSTQRGATCCMPTRLRCSAVTLPSTNTQAPGRAAILSREASLYCCRHR